MMPDYDEVRTRLTRKFGVEWDELYGGSRGGDRLCWRSTYIDVIYRRGGEAPGWEISMDPPVGWGMIDIDTDPHDTLDEAIEELLAAIRRIREKFEQAEATLTRALETP